MIGELMGRGGWTATLEDDGTWTCDDPVVEMTLRHDFARDRYCEADGVFGRRLLLDAAARLGAVVEAAWYDS